MKFFGYFSIKRMFKIMGQFDYNFGISFRTQRDKTQLFFECLFCHAHAKCFACVIAYELLGKLLCRHFTPLIADN